MCKLQKQLHCNRSLLLEAPGAALGKQKAQSHGRLVQTVGHKRKPSLCDG